MVALFLWITGGLRGLGGGSTDGIPDSEASAGLEPGKLPIGAAGVEGDGQLLWKSLKLQLHLGADSLWWEASR